MNVAVENFKHFDVEYHLREKKISFINHQLLTYFSSFRF